MFSFAMTSSLASDSDKFKIIITLRRAQKFGDTGPYKNFDFLFNRLPAAMKCRGHGVPEMVTPAMRTTAVLLGFLNLTNMFSFAMTCSLASDSDKFKIIITLRRAQKFGDTGPYKNFDFLFKPFTGGDEVPGARSTRDGDTGNEDNSSFARFFKLDKYVMFSFAMTSSLASDSDKFKIIITLRRAQKFGDTGPYKNFDFLFNRLPAAMKCRGHGVPEMVTPAMRTTAVLLGFLNLTNMSCSVLP